MEVNDDAAEGQRRAAMRRFRGQGWHAQPAVQLIRSLGGSGRRPQQLRVEREFLKGRAKLPGIDVFSL